VAAIPNTALRLLRERTPSLASPGECLSRQELADLVNAHVLQSTQRPGALDANYIGKLERGVITWPRAHYRQGLRAVLAADTDRELGLTRPTRIGRSVAAVDRPAFLATGLVTAPTSASDGPLAAMTRLPVAVSREHVDALRATAVMFTDADHSHGGGDVTGAAGVYLGHAAELLRLPCPASLRPELFSAVGWLGHIVGWAAFDATRHNEAGEAFAFALACAEQGGDWHLRAKVLSSMAREAIWRGDADTGLTWIELALVRADRLTATERAMLLTARARALARLGRVDDTMRTVRAADEHFRHTNPGVDPPWMSYYDTAQHLGDTGHALFDLAVHGHYVKEATRRLTAAVAGHQPLYVRSRAMSGMKLATLTLRAGDPVEGAAIGNTALSDLDHLRSARTVQVVIGLDRAAVPHTRLPEVARLRYDLAEVITPA
jgi:hypothetical protein